MESPAGRLRAGYPRHHQTDPDPLPPRRPRPQFRACLQRRRGQGSAGARKGRGAGVPRRGHGKRGQRPGSGALDARGPRQPVHPHRAAHRPAGPGAGRARDRQLRHQRLQGKDRARPHQAVHHHLRRAARLPRHHEGGGGAPGPAQLPRGPGARDRRLGAYLPAAQSERLRQRPAAASGRAAAPGTQHVAAPARRHPISGENDYEILAQIGDDDGNMLSPDVLAQLDEAKSNKISRVQGDTYIGYFPNSSGKASLLVLKGVEEISEIDAKLLEVFCSGVAIAFDNILLTQENADAQAELILRLGDVVESRSNEAGNHVRRMSEVCHLLAKVSGLPEDETAVLRHTAPMHDIGKIATPDAVLLKPGKLDAAEWEIMKQHPAVGLSILDGSQRPILKAAAVIAHQHHEKFDGSGYPQGLKGHDIHLYARIVAVADVFDALMHRRCYKEAWPIDKVVEHLREVAGHHLDPVYVEYLCQNIDQALAINERSPD